MNTILTIPGLRRGVFAQLARAGLCAGTLVLFSLAATAQDAPRPNPPAASPADQAFDLFGTIGRWLDESIASINSNFKGTREKIDSFNREAGIAVKSTADAAKDAAGAVVRLPNTRVISGHQNCPTASNGAPNCIVAANALCKSQGFSTGKSVDMTTAEECPTQVLLGQRQALPGECRTVTFVTRALCQ